MKTAVTTGCRESGLAFARRNVAHRLSAGNDGAFLRGLLDLLLLVEGAAEVEDAHDEHHQQRQCDGKLQQRRAPYFPQQS